MEAIWNLLDSKEYSSPVLLGLKSKMFGLGSS